MQEGKILVVPFTNNEMLPSIKKAAALVVEADGFGSHAATVGMALEIPVIMGADYATQILKNGTVVTIDARPGIGYYGETMI